MYYASISLQCLGGLARGLLAFNALPARCPMPSSFNLLQTPCGACLSCPRCLFLSVVFGSSALHLPWFAISSACSCAFGRRRSYAGTHPGRCRPRRRCLGRPARRYVMIVEQYLGRRGWYAMSPRSLPVQRWEAMRPPRIGFNRTPLLAAS